MPLADDSCHEIGVDGADGSAIDVRDLEERVGAAPGTRQRQIMRQSLSGFLRYCVERRQFKSCWLPPSSVDGEYFNEKRVGYPLTEAQVLRLIEAMPDSKAGERWRFALQLMAV